MSDSEHQVTVGLLGAGFVGSYVLRRIREDRLVRLGAVLDADEARTRDLPASTVVKNIAEFGRRGIDLVLEVATSAALVAGACKILENSDLVPCSLTAFADKIFRENVIAAQSNHGRRVFIPHGAIVGLDGIHDGRHLIEHITVTTTKNPRNIEGGGDFNGYKGQKLLFEGPTMEACRRFPRNVNVHAAVALAGIGFERTLSRLIADTEHMTMRHNISVQGRGFRWELALESDARSGVTGSYTPESVYQFMLRAATRGDALQL